MNITIPKQDHYAIPKKYIENSEDHISVYYNTSTKKKVVHILDIFKNGKVSYNLTVFLTNMGVPRMELNGELEGEKISVTMNNEKDNKYKRQ